MGAGDWAWAKTEHKAVAQASHVRREKKDSESMAKKTQDREPAYTSKGAEFNQSSHSTSG
jgi:hypothetical protein